MSSPSSLNWADMKFSWETTEPLGVKYRGLKVTPINKVFYDKFPYKISFNGNRNYRDIDFHSHLTDFLYDNYSWYHNSQYSSKSRNVYLTRKWMVDEVMDFFGHEVKELHGPLNDEHILQLQGTKYNLEYRDKYWYNKFDTKIEFFRPHNTDVDLSDLKSFIAGSFEEYHWYDFGSRTWYNNYLYVNSEELDSVYPFLKINYGEVIDNIVKCKLLEK